MLELSAVHVEKGIFELTLEDELPPVLRSIGRLGPIKTRLISVTLLLLAASLNFTTKPALYFMNVGLAGNTLAAINLQAMLKWSIVGVALLVWAVAFLLRRGLLTLVFDRPGGLYHFRQLSRWNLGPIAEGSGAFSEIKAIRVFGPQRDPKTPYGFMEVEILPANKVVGMPNLFRFKLLSEDQLKIYPANLAKIVGREPEGDWVEPS
jgi:hypothetical protein